MTMHRCEVQTGDQQGYSTSTGNYVAATGNMSVNANQVLYYRMPQALPGNVTINSATLRLPYSVKDGNVTQSSFHNVYIHNSGNSPVLVAGVAERTRITGSDFVQWNPTWTAGETGRKVATLDITDAIRKIVQRDDFQPGGYITVMIWCTNENGSDMNLSTTFDAFAEKVAIHVDYTESSTAARRWNINRSNNSAFTNGAGTDWSTNPLFGSHTDVGGTLSWDRAHRRNSTNGSLKYTTPAPQETRSTVYINYVGEINPSSWLFSGWIYVPSYVTSVVEAKFAYQGDATRQLITQRDQWVPFCTPVFNAGTAPEDAGNVGLIMPMIQIRYPFEAGWEVWLSEPAVYRSNGPRQMPWTGTSPNNSVVEHYHTGPTDESQSVRTWIPRTGIPGQARRSPKWRLHDSGLLQLAEPQSQTVHSAQTWNDIPSTMTYNDIATFEAWESL